MYIDFSGLITGEDLSGYTYPKEDLYTKEESDERFELKGQGGSVADVKVDGTSVVDPRTKEANISHDGFTKGYGIVDFLKITKSAYSALTEYSDSTVYVVVDDPEYEIEFGLTTDPDAWVGIMPKTALWNTENKKWYMRRGDDTFVEYGQYASGTGFTGYEGELSVVGSSEYEFSGGSWHYVGEVITYDSPEYVTNEAGAWVLNLSGVTFKEYGTRIAVKVSGTTGDSQFGTQNSDFYIHYGSSIGYFYGGSGIGRGNDGTHEGHEIEGGLEYVKDNTTGSIITGSIEDLPTWTKVVSFNMYLNQVGVSYAKIFENDDELTHEFRPIVSGGTIVFTDLVGGGIYQPLAELTSSGTMGTVSVYPKTYSGKEKPVLTIDEYADYNTIAALPNNEKYFGMSAITNTPLALWKLNNYAAWEKITDMYAISYTKRGTGATNPNVTTFGSSNFVMATDDRLLFDGEITTIPNNAFKGSEWLSEIVLPSSVTTLGNAIFSGAPLEKITAYMDAAPSIGNTTFDGMLGFGTLVYKNGADYSAWLNVEDSKTLGYKGWNMKPKKMLKITTDYSIATLVMDNNGGNNPFVGYSRDGINWRPVIPNKADIIISDGIYIAGYNPDGFNHTSSKYTTFRQDYGNIYLLSFDGDVMALINCMEDVKDIPCDYCFYSLFNPSFGDNFVKKGPELTATGLTRYCYAEMFRCGAYSGSYMAEAPHIYATDATPERCCENMFQGCTGLTSITADFVQIGANSLNNWVKNVSPTGVFHRSPNLSESSITRGDGGIPTGWTVDPPFS